MECYTLSQIFFLFFFFLANPKCRIDQVFSKISTTSPRHYDSVRTVRGFSGVLIKSKDIYSLGIGYTTDIYL